MSNSYRIRTQVGVDKSIKILIDQDFEYLEILSLKILPSQIYTRQCSDYGVVIGRVTANDGFGIPNAKVSVFIPLSDTDAANPIISELYPYKTLTDLNEDGYRYNLLPYRPSYSNHSPTGSFFDKHDVLVEPTLIEVYDKYYKYTAKTNESGDYMIFGVPTGDQTIHVDVDLSDIGEFSLSPQDLIRMGIATPDQVAGNKFKSSTNLNELPQIISLNNNIEVEPLWGQPEVCNLGVTRTDFDLTSGANILITPTSIFMGSIMSSNDDQFQKRNCKPKVKQGNLCNLVAGPGEILAIRQTIYPDISGQPILETVELEGGGQVIDDNGTWLIDVPMNLDYVITNEFGERVLSNDSKKGVPTKGKYRFKVKWNQSTTLSEPVKRGYFLVPNIREYGWVTSNDDPLKYSPSSAIYQGAIKSYAFSLDWNDYADVSSAVNCEDTFYEMMYNKVYTVSQLMDQYRKGYLSNRMVSIKNIMDDSCESEIVKYPTNDSVLRFDLIYLLFIILFFITKPLVYITVILMHIFAFLVNFVLIPLLVMLGLYLITLAVQNFIAAGVSFPALLLILPFALIGLACLLGAITVTFLTIKIYKVRENFKNITIPNLSYPDCEMCSCDEGTSIDETGASAASVGGSIPPQPPASAFLSTYTLAGNYQNVNPGWSEPYKFQNIMGGAYIDTLHPTPTSLVPQLQSYGDPSDNGHLFTTSITLAERINLFNNKAKYFDDAGGFNPGGGENRIKVTFDTTLNNPLAKFHYDNVLVISCQPSNSSLLQPGQLISFQDPMLSTDVNITGFTTYNQFGSKSITGTTINNSGTLQISYANPDGSGTISPSNSLYIINQDPTDALYAKFPIDIEYYQVITAMTYNSFSGLSNPGGSDITLNNRYLNNEMAFTLVSITNCAAETFPGSGLPLLLYDNPLQSYLDGGLQVLTFLVRGVDPNSTRLQNSYDLSKLFGYPTSVPSLVVGGPTLLYKLNYPIQGSFASVRHNMTSDVTQSDPWTTDNLYYDSFHFLPEPNPLNAGFTGFTSNLPSYYSSLDDNFGFTPAVGSPGLYAACHTDLITKSASINPFVPDPLSAWAYNGFTIEWDQYVPSPLIPGFCGGYYGWTVNTYSLDNRGYFINEIVDGGSVMLQSIELIPNVSSYVGYSAIYYAPRYSGTYSYTNLGSSGNQIVMRSDRLPTSTSVVNNLNNSYALHSNTSFGAFLISDEGTSSTLGGTASNSPSISDSGEFSEEAFTGVSTSILETFTCGGMVPLSCYKPNGNEVDVAPDGDDCYTCEDKNIMVNGCYVLVTTIFLSLPRDLRLITEWSSRLQITFAACRNVWSHIFTNNWINGSLYAFSFKNDRFYDALNRPYSKYCRDTLVLHPTNNFYYRSSPWKNGVGFIGSDAPTPLSGSGTYGGNFKNLKYPTTIMDLGPRSQYLQEITMSDDYDGYVVNNLGETTFTDISEILNLFIISRLTNTSFLNQMFGTGGANVLSYFDKRSKQFVDADYAQMISISSELGVADFEPENYPTAPGPPQDAIYFNNFNVGNGIIGIFFSSDTQVRDFITPRRTIINNNAVITDSCTFNNINVFTQEIPLYQWEVKSNSDTDSIFGSQSNDWYTSPISGSKFFTHKYQTLDRLDPNSRYFRGSTSNIKDFKGYIYQVDGAGLYEPNPATQDPNIPLSRTITVGAPFHFYFGLKKGKTSFDRFATKWLSFETITD